MISIITATYNSSAQIEPLIDSLNKQTDQDFEWVVVDGASKDDTVEKVKSLCQFDPVIICEPDQGIYDAFNKGIQRAKGEYYICIGSDDYFYADAVELFNSKIANKQCDVYSFDVDYGQVRVQKSNKPLWLVLYRKYTSAHSVATIFRKSLHDQYGYYSLNYSIGADLEFILKIFQSKNTTLDYTSHPVGYFNPAGVSSTAIKASLDEVYDIAKSLGFNPILQKLVCTYRLIKFKLKGA